MFLDRIKKYSHPSFSAREKILEYDKFYHTILKEVWYTWTFADILKKHPSEIDNINNIWELHKLRNKLAHDIADINESLLNKKAIEFEKELLNLLNKFT